VKLAIRRLTCPLQAEPESGPAEDGHADAERLRVRDVLLNESLFFSLDHARQKLTAWTADYNTARPYSAIGYQLLRLTPRT